jgi:hypothetical protein
MSEKIILVRGDDTDFNYQVLLVLNFISTLNLEGYKARLTIENPTNVIKTYEIFNNTCEVNFDKSITSTLEVGEHRCTVKLLNSLNQIKTIYNFDILVQDEFDISTKFINEYTVDIKIDDGINKYKNYNELFNKPLINGVELVGDKSFEDLGITEYTENTIDNKIEEHNVNIESHLDIRQELNNKQDTLIAGSNITIIDGIISSLGAQGGVTTDYKELGNKPKINNVTLVDNVSLEDLGVQPVGEYITEEDLDNKGYLTAVPTGYVTEEELNSYNFLTEVPEDYYTNTQNEEIYAKKEDLNNKQNILTAGENITIEAVDENTVISANIPEQYITEDELLERNYINSDYLATQLNKKQNLMRAGNNIRFYQNADGSYTISAVDGQSSPSIVSYNALSNKPQIGGIELIGNKSLLQLGIQPAGEYSPILTAGDNITIEQSNGETVISAIIPEDICTDAELEAGLLTKANKATTLSGYNIENAYTKNEVDGLFDIYLNNKVSDIVESAPNKTIRYTEKTITLQSNTEILFANGLNIDNTLKSLRVLNENDLILDLNNSLFDDEWKDFYIIAIYENDILSLKVIPCNKFTMFNGEVIPLTLNGYVKHIYQNKYYEMVENNGVNTPTPKIIKILGKGTAVADENMIFKITSVTPCGVNRIATEDEVLRFQEYIDANYQRNLTFGDNFNVENNVVNYQVPSNYISVDYLVENDYVTQTNINDAVRIHNANGTSHEDIRQLIQNTRDNYVTKTQFNQLVTRVSILEDKVDAILNRLGE